MYSAVQDKSANYTVVAGDAGDLIRVTTTSGAVTITLPTISTVGDGFKVAIVKWTGDANAVTVNRSSTNTINGATSATIGAQYSSTTFVADLETGQWFAASSGLGTSNVAVDAFSGNNSTTAFTLSGDPGSENNTQVYVSGVYQEKDTYSVSGTTLTFSTAPPTGTSNIEVVWTAPLAIGTPSDGTVTTAKIADGALTADTTGRAKMADAFVTQAKLGTGVAGNGPAFSAYASATQAVASSTTTKIVYDTEVFDTNSNFASNRFTPTIAGYYQISSGLFLPGSASGGAILYLYKNGGEYAQFSRLNMSSSLNIMGSGSILVYLNGSTDYVEMYVNQNSGSTLNIGQGNQASCWFTGVLARSA